MEEKQSLRGDFRQVTPVVFHATKTQIIENCIKSSHVWKNFKTIKLNTNMRAGYEQQQFNKYLLELGNGELNVFNNLDFLINYLI